MVSQFLSDVALTGIFCVLSCALRPLSQVYNEFNARSIGDKAWVFGGLLGNHLFCAIIVITIGLQVCGLCGAIRYPSVED